MGDAKGTAKAEEGTAEAEAKAEAGSNGMSSFK